MERDLPKPDPRKATQVPPTDVGGLGLVGKILSPSPEPFAEGSSCPSPLSQIPGGPGAA